MALRITKAEEPITVERLTLCLYAPPGIGKTSTAFTAGRVLLLDFDHGAYRSQFRRDTVQVGEWADVADISAEDLADYDVVAIDTAGRALDTLTQVVIASDPKNGTRGGALSLQGYGALKTAFIAWLKRLHSFGKDVILLAHSDEQRKGDEVIERLDVQGGSKNEIYKVADAMGRLYVIDGKRFLNFSPTDVAFGKNPAQLPALKVPDFNAEPDFLAKIIGDIKSKLNALGAEAIAEQAKMDEWREAFTQLDTAEAFTARAAELANQAPKVKALLTRTAKAKGFTYDKKAGAFVVEQKAAA